MVEKPELIEGGSFTDERGTVAFVNDFDLKDVRRFYTITHPETETVRAWQGHREESKWFYCLRGSFRVAVVKIDDWENPSDKLPASSFTLNESESQVLFVPPGFANGFRALKPGSELLVFSDKSLDESAGDDFRFDKNLWYNWKV